MRSWKSVSGILFFILLASFVADNSNYFFIRLVYPNSYIIGNTWMLINYLLSVLLFYKVLARRHNILKAIIVSFVIGAIISFFFYSFLEANTFLNVWSSASFILFALFLFMDILEYGKSRLVKSPLFWIATIYFVTSSLVLIRGLFSNTLIFELNISEESYLLIMFFNIFSNIGKNILIFYILVLLHKGFPDSLIPPKTQHD